MLPPLPALPHPPVPGEAEQSRMENRRRTLKGGQKSPQQLLTGTGREQDGRRGCGQEMILVLAASERVRVCTPAFRRADERMGSS